MQPRAPNHFDRPSEQAPGFVPFAARVLPAQRPIPLPATLPSLPCPQRASPFPDYELTTHLTPCARPRAHRSATTRSVRPPYPPPPEAGGSGSEHKQCRAKEMRELEDKMWAQRVEMLAEKSWQGDGDGEPLLWAVVNRFLRKRLGGGVTLLFVPATGYPKETWEPCIAMLLERYAKVDEIFVWETYNHGDAALVNALTIGDTFDWADNARDVLQFLTYHRPLAGETNAPVCLPPHEREEQPRRIVGVGHSHGGEVVARAALSSPDLFDALVLVDPVILSETLVIPTRRASQKKRDDALTRATLSRRAVWPSMEHARNFFEKAPFFQTWHPAVLKAYIDHGLCLVPGTDSKKVMLKQCPYDEASFYVEPRGPAETWYQLAALDERIELRWVLGNAMESFQGGEAYARHSVWRRPKNSSNMVVKQAGHFIPQEAPEQLAREIADLLIRRDALLGSRAQSTKARL
ncbi:alpha/beta-hydrolase [Calocera cornea HHB12733]|uniref:Alpha/beta-hydrolase n=1 Tax=Calocera cornea HHB12733 TaxID=1353952 RepID=A0A165EB04_9BASI|nr:alpha/beta-hydrolase [Calocera cornea HHB12733]